MILTGIPLIVMGAGENLFLKTMYCACLVLCDDDENHFNLNLKMISKTHLVLSSARFPAFHFLHDIYIFQPMFFVLC